MLRSLMFGVLAGALLPACYAQEMISAPEAQADAQTLYEGLQAAHYDLYANTPRPVFDQYYRELQEELGAGPVSLSDYHVTLQRFSARADFAHTRVDTPHPGFSAFVDDGGLVFPLSFEVRDGEVVITQAPADAPVEPGDRIVSLEGASNADWVARLTRNISAETPALAYSQMERQQAYFIWLEFGARPTFAAQVEDVNGQARTVTLSAIPASELSNRVGLQSLNLWDRDARMLTSEIAYLRPGGFFNLDAQAPEEYFAPEALERFLAFIDDSFETFIAEGAEALIIDLRNNPGGDNSYSDPMLAWIADRPFRFASDFRIRVSEQSTASNQMRIDAAADGQAGLSNVIAELYADASPGDILSYELEYAAPREGRRFEGAVYALVNRKSFSNAVSVGAIIQDYGFGQVIGEATTDMTTTYGAMEHFTLPHSGFRIGYPKALIIRPNGDEHAHPLSPDVRLATPQVGDQGDVVLEAAVAHVEGQTP